MFYILGFESESLSLKVSILSCELYVLKPFTFLRFKFNV